MKKRIKIAAIIGTRPDIIKMASVILKLKKNPLFKLSVITTAQHRQMFDQMLKIFSISVDSDLDIMKEDQTLPEILGRLTMRLTNIIKKIYPDIVLVQGDTATAFAASLAAFYNKICVGHIEAGLRTHDKYQPYPEEINRKLVSSLADLHFAPTKIAKNNLLRERIKENNIYITGNTVIDSLLMTTFRIKKENKYFDGVLPPVGSKMHKIILVTAHRRENWGAPIRNICKALRKLASTHSDISIVYPVHLNSNIRKPVFEMLGKTPRIFLLPPLDYEQFVVYLSKSYLIVTDSGGIQEEAPSLGKPVIVLREITERPEAVKAGTVKIVGTKSEKIISEVNNLLSNKEEYKRMAHAVNPYGDGKAAERIIKILLYYFNLSKTIPFEFKPKYGKIRV